MKFGVFEELPRKRVPKYVVIQATGMCDYGDPNQIIQTWFGQDFTKLSNSKDYLENYIIN